MKNTILIILIIISYGICISQSTLNLSANYETIGTTIILSDNDPEMDAHSILEYKRSIDSDWIMGFPLSRVNNNLKMCSGSIFWLKPNTTYDVKLQIIDSTTNVLNGQTLEGTVHTKQEPEFNTENGTTLHVNPSGTNGSFTLQQAIDLAQPGEVVLLDTGTYFIGNITFPNDGNASNPIMIRGVNTETVILDGSHTSQLLWTPYGANGIYQTTTSAINPNLVIADGVRLYPHQTFPDLVSNKITLSYFPIREYPADVGGFYRNPTLLPLANFGDPVGIATNKLYLKLLDGSDPNTKNIAVTKQATCFKFDNNHHITIKNLTIKNYGLGHIATAIQISNSSNITIDSCDFKANNSGIRLKNNCTDILIQRCNFKDYFFNWNAWKIKSTQDIGTLFDSRFPFNSRNLELGSLVFSHDFIGNNIVFRKNIVQDYHQGGQMAPAPPGGSSLDDMPKSLEIDFYENTIINCRGDGFECEGIVRNVRVFKNHFIECHAPLSLATAEEGPLYILRNTFSNIIPDYYDDGFNLVQAVGHPLKFQGRVNAINGDIFFYHNTVDAQNIAFAMNVFHTTTANAWKKLESKNNILTTDSGTSLNVRTLNGIPNFISDYNAYFSNDSDISCVTFNNSNPDCYSNISALFPKYGWDEHSIQGDPLFVNPSADNYQLQNNSPAINKGTIIQGINDRDYKGDKPDVGAFENGMSVSISEEEKGFIKIYPNPTNDVVFLELKGEQKFTHYSIFDLTGKMVAHSTINGKINKIDIGNLPAGMYVFQIKNTEKVFSYRLVKG